MKLVNKSGGAISLYRPAGDPGSLTVEPGQSCEIPGELVTEAPEDVELPDDGYLVKLPDGDYRVFSYAQWSTEQKEAEPSGDDVPTSAVTPKDEG